MNKIYTKTGDKGMTSLLSGRRVPKYHIRLEVCGTIDELNSYLGLLRTYVDEKTNFFLLDIQVNLFKIASIIASEGEKRIVKKEIRKKDIALLEKKIDTMEKGLQELTNFIIPGGEKKSALCHVARTVCRRVERRLIKLSTKKEIDEQIIIYFNRLSDFLFVLARKLCIESDGDEKIWKDCL